MSNLPARSLSHWLTALLLFIVVGAAIACDPLAPDASAVVIVLTSTPTRPPLPTAIPQATASLTISPPTATPTNAPFPSATVWVCNEQKGQLVDLTMLSGVAKTTVRYRVYLPPCYTQTSKRYPYVILMHGSDGDEKEWTDDLGVHSALDAGIDLQALPPMILVMPNGGDLANLNIFAQGQSWENVVVNELIPDVERNFCTWNAREGRAIGGISRGGFWVFEIAFRHPELFGAVAGHSPFFDPDNAPPQYNPLSLAKTIEYASGEQPRFWIDAGKDDYARPNIEIFQKTLADRGIDPGYTMMPEGKHEKAYWASHVAEYLSFYGQAWPRNIKDLPSCLQ